MKNELNFYVKKITIHPLTQHPTTELVCGWVKGDDAVKFAIELKKSQHITTIVEDAAGKEVTRYTVRTK